MTNRRTSTVPKPFDLAATCGPVAWASGRWPNQDWIDGTLIWLGWEAGTLVWRTVQSIDDGHLAIDGTADPIGDADWTRRVLGAGRTMPPMSDPVLRRVASRYPGLRPYASGSVFDGLIDSIVGQSITVKAAAVVGARIAALHHPGIELSGRIFWPSPTAEQLAGADPARLRQAGLTWRRAEAIVHAARVWADGAAEELDGGDPDRLRAFLRTLPLVGRWTAESTLLWGLGLDDAHPSGDVALLRAARRTYDDPAMTLRDLDERSSQWRGHRGWAARLLWTDLFGPAPRVDR